MREQVLSCLSSFCAGLLSGFGNEASQAIEFFRGDSRHFAAEQRGDHIFHGAVKKSLDEVPERGTPRDVAGNRRKINISQAVLFMADMAFFFEHAKLRADGRIVRLVRESGEDLADRGAIESVENIHDLAFAAGEKLAVWLSYLRALIVLAKRFKK